MEEQGLQLACPEWTADDFRTEKPFEWLYERRSNKFVLMQLVEVIAEKAGALSVKNFRILWKAYLESKAATKGSTWKSEIDLPNKPNYVPDLSCREYSVSNDGIQTADRYGFPIEVCSHPILPIRRLVNVDTGEVKTEIAFTRNGKWNRIIFSKETLANRAKITEIDLEKLKIENKQRDDAIAELREIEFREIELRSRRTALGEEISRLDIRAPVTGVVYGSAADTLRGVVRAGGYGAGVLKRFFSFLFSHQLLLCYVSRFDGTRASLSTTMSLFPMLD